MSDYTAAQVSSCSWKTGRVAAVPRGLCFEDGLVASIGVVGSALHGWWHQPWACRRDTSPEACPQKARVPVGLGGGRDMQAPCR